MLTEKLPEIWDRFDVSDAAELVVECGQERIVLRRFCGAHPDDPVSARYAADKEKTQTVPKPPLPPETGTGKSGQASAAGRIVKAPLVGTFYRAPAPDADPYVLLGQQVCKGDVVGIVEAMKMMNEITAPCDGIVSRILAEDETLVEFGQELMCIGEENERC